MTWTVKAVAPDRLKAFWPVVAPLLAPAVAQSGGRVTMRTLYEGLTEHRYLLWVALNDQEETTAALTTRVASYPARKMLSIDFVGGADMDGWLPTASATFRAYARDTGLDGVEGGGRPGWVKALKRLGWTPSVVVVEVTAADRQESV